MPRRPIFSMEETLLPTPFACTSHPLSIILTTPLLVLWTSHNHVISSSAVAQWTWTCIDGLWWHFCLKCEAAKKPLTANSVHHHSHNATASLEYLCIVYRFAVIIGCVYNESKLNELSIHTVTTHSADGNNQHFTIDKFQKFAIKLFSCRQSTVSCCYSIKPRFFQVLHGFRSPKKADLQRMPSWVQCRNAAKNVLIQFHNHHVVLISNKDNTGSLYLSVTPKSYTKV